MKSNMPYARMEPSSGIEPPTSSLPRMRSTTELQGRKHVELKKIGHMATWIPCQKMKFAKVIFAETSVNKNLNKKSDFLQRAPKRA